MAGNIKLFGGVKEKMPSLAERMVGYCTDACELYVGGETGNVLIASARGAQGSFDRLTLAPTGQPPEAGQLVADMSGGLAFKSADGQLRHVAFRAQSVPAVPAQADQSQMIEALNSLIAALKGAGAMEE